MGTFSYTALRGIAKTGYLKTTTDIRASIEEDDFKSGAVPSLSGLLADQWVLASGFNKSQNNGWRQAAENSSGTGFKTLTPPMSHVRLSGNTNNNCTTPDSPATSVTGDIDLRARVAPFTWFPASPGAVISKRSAGQASYQLIISASSFLNLVWSNDGSTILSKLSTVVVPYSDDGQPHHIRATLDVDDGAGNNVVKFYTSEDGVNWTQLGATVTTAGTTSIFNGTAQVEIGTEAGTGNVYKGRIFYAEIRNGINGSRAAFFDPSRANRGASSFVASTGETWTLNSSSTPASIFQGAELADEGAEYLLLPGEANDYASTPDSASNSITGDIDLRLKVSCDDWTPGAAFEFLDKITNDTTQFSYLLRLNTDGTLQLYWSTDGTTPLNAQCTVPTGFVDGTAHWIRAALDVDDGAGNRVTRFYVSEDGVTWAQLGATVTTAGTTSIFNGTAEVQIGGGRSGVSGFFAGKVYYVEIRNGIGGQVVNCFDPGRALAGATTLQGRTASGETWTINQSGSPKAELIRNTPVVLEGYVRGLGQTYSLEFYSEAADRSVEVDRVKQVPRDRSAPEVLVYGRETFFNVTILGPNGSLLDEAALVQYREFFASVEGGELFKYDRYGTIAAPIAPVDAILSDDSYREERVTPTLFKISLRLQTFE